MNLPEDGGRIGKEHKLVPVEIQAAICIRPLLKKERDDTIVLEAKALAGEHGKAVALHPLPPKINCDSIAPSAALVLQTMSPDTIQTGHDEEFRFDHVFAANAEEVLNSTGTPHACLQNQVYTRLGRPMALRSMEALKSSHSTPRTSQLIVTMGSPASGKSHICWGPGSVSKRKSHQDGLVLRMVDSFFGQFLRLKPSSSASNGYQQHYALNLSFLQLNQESQGASHSSCELHDLLQNVKNNHSGANLFAPQVKAFTRWAPHKKSPSPSSSSETSDEPSIFLQQDPNTNDFHVVNCAVQTCRTMEDARETILEALNNSRKLSTKRRYQAHILVQMQPVLLEKPKASSRILMRGGMISVLDMAGFDESDRKCNRRHRSTDSLPNRSDAYTALIHCLRSIQYNEMLRMGKTPLSDSLDDADDDDATKMSEITCSVMTSPKAGMERQPSFKKVPYPRHKLTMLLQPLFSTTFTDETYVTLLMAASPGTRDYGEKKGLLQELESFVNARIGPAKAVMTGLNRDTALDRHTKFVDMSVKEISNAKPHKASSHVKRETEYHQSRKHHAKLSQPQRPKQKKSIERRGSEADDEAEEKNPLSSRGIQPLPPPKALIPGVFCDRKKGVNTTPVVQKVASMTYSDTSEEADVESLPPPFAPPPLTRQSPSARYLESPRATAPHEAEIRSSVGNVIMSVRAIPSNDNDDDEATPIAPSLVPIEEVQHYTSTTTTTTAVTNGSSDSNPSATYYTTSTSSGYFRPMQHTLKKVVNVGKKKCGKVWEKMYSNHMGNTNTGSGSALVESDQDPVSESQFLVEVESLRHALIENEKAREHLQQQVDTLRLENKHLREAEQERDNLREQLAELQRQRGSDTTFQKQPVGQSTNAWSATLEMDENESVYPYNLTPRSRAFADITAPRLPVHEKAFTTRMEPKESTRTLAEIQESGADESTALHLTPKSRAYADIVAPRVPLNENYMLERTFAPKICTGTGAATRSLLPVPKTQSLPPVTTTHGPLTGSAGSLKAHMAKLSTHGPVVPSPVGSPWNRW